MCANQGSQNLLGKKLEKDGGKQALGKLQSGLLETADADQITASQLGARQVAKFSTRLRKLPSPLASTLRKLQIPNS